MRILEPTLIKGSATLVANAGVDSAEVDFDFGNLEGALLLGVDYIYPSIGVTGLMAGGIAFDPNKVTPATAELLFSDEGMFAKFAVDEVLVTTGGSTTISRHLALTHLSLYIARNISVHAVTVDANNRGYSCCIYYKRVQFTQEEIGGVIAFRR